LKTKSKSESFIITFNNKMKLAVASDLHLDHYTVSQQKDILNCFDNDDSDTIILAGDLGNPFSDHYLDLLNKCKEQYKYVLFIAGNHEFYQDRTETDVEEKLESLSWETNTIFLQKHSWRHPSGTVISGCTLWTDISPTTFAYVRNKHSLLTYSDVVEIHQDHKQWIESVAAETDIMVTHHLPTVKMVDPKYGNSPYNDGYASPMEYLFKPPLKLWICGHTHTASRKYTNGIPCMSNPLGYPEDKNSWSVVTTTVDH
jgi:predicted phosphodiesterase